MNVFFLAIAVLLPFYNQGRIRPYESSEPLERQESIANRQIESMTLYLREKGVPPEEISLQLADEFILDRRLVDEAGPKLLPGGRRPGTWYSLHTLGIRLYNPQNGQLQPIDNFTAFRDADFDQIQAAYLASNHEALMSALRKGYSRLEGKRIGTTSLFYPTFGQLRAETLYMSLPWVLMIAAAYAIGALLPWGVGRTILILTFAAHTLLLIARSYILGRPPVSNMLETILYVPWVGMLISFFFRDRIATRAAGLIASFLLLLQLLDIWGDEMQNVQPVLNSTYWLMVHVMMVVASYGAFVLAGILGHVALIRWTILKKSVHIQPILQSMYIGTALLIGGTILGGVWAAESWGRFWDWDPKESWAFISSCVYVAIIHMHRFKMVGTFGLSVGAIVGLQAITFTWYGVNYVLGTGLHSYGFGIGGEIFYFLFLAAEVLFLVAMFYAKKSLRVKT